VLEGSSPEHAITESPEVDVIRGVPATEVVLALNHGGSLAGRVQSAVDGKPVAGAAVVIMNSKFGAVSPMIILGNVDVSDRRTTTDAQGRFRVPNLRGGTFWLRIEHDSFAPRRVDEVTVDRGRETPLEDILLFVGGRIRGVVLRTDGKPDAEAEIQVTSPNPDRPFDRRVATDHRGAFELDQIPPGEYLVLPIKKAGKFDVMGLINATGTKILVEEGRVREVSF
jgi:hypothetical protein